MILIIAVIFIGLYFLLEQLFKSAWGTRWKKTKKHTADSWRTKTDDHTTDD